MSVSTTKGEMKMNDNSRAKELDLIAANIVRLVTASVKRGTASRHYAGEQPTRERIKASIPWNITGVSQDEQDYVMDIVYPKLRKNSVLAKLR